MTPTSQRIVCSLILQLCAISGIIALAVLYDGYLTYLAYIILSGLLGINLGAILRHKPTKDDDWRP